MWSRLPQTTRAGPPPGWPETLQQLGTAKRIFSRSLDCSLEARTGKTSGAVGSCFPPCRQDSRKSQAEGTITANTGQVLLCAMLNTLHIINSFDSILTSVSDEETEARHREVQ